MAKLCMGCMNPLPEGSDTCGICGFPANGQNPAHALATATVLQEHYLVGRLVEEGSDNLLYLGYDRVAKEPCLIAEYYPNTLSTRTPEGAVAPLSGCEHSFYEYRDEYHTQMRALARVKDLPSMIPIYDIFEENGTVYAVSDYCEGVTLTKKLKQCGGRLPWSEARPLFMSLLTCVTQLHSTHIRHLAICPDNILIGKDGKARLRNFSIAAAHCAGNALKPTLAEGYAAPEQYQPDGEITDATDVYGLAATVFAAVTGNVPPAGNRRAKDSDDLFMSAEIAEELSQQVCVALFNALQADPALRTGTVAELQNQFSEEPNVSALRKEARADQLAQNTGKKKSRAPLIALIVVIVALLVILGVLLITALGRSQQNQSDDSEVVLPTLSTTTTRGKTETLYSVPNLLGKLYYDVQEKDLQGGMTFKIKYKEYNAKPAGTILSQEPKAGTSVKKGAEIVVVVSCGKDDTVIVPDVSGWKEEHATLYLQALGFRVEVARLQASTYEKGLVDSTDPAVGTKKAVGDTITLRVSDVDPLPEEPDSTDDTGNNFFNSIFG